MIKRLYDKIYSKEFKEGAKMHEKDFTRKRKLGFTENVLFILSGTKKSLQSALYTFFREMKIQEETYTKQAFSKGRQRIKPEAFLELFKITVTEFYQYADYKTYKGYRITAIDGTRYNLPNTEELLDKYGMQKSTNMVQSLSSCLYDVMNGIILDTHMHPFNANERELALLHIDELEKINTDKEILLMDRGYPASKLFKSIEEKGFNFVARCEPNFIKSMKIKGKDCIVEHEFKSGICLKLRVIRTQLDNGNEEILITNILDKFTVKDFANLYHMRWGIEEKYDDLKNKLEIENFSGTTDIAILQDFYATMFLNNLAATMAYEYSDEIDDKYNTKDLKYKYKANISMTISILKINLIEMLSTNSSGKRNKLFSHIISQLMNCVVPVRPDRSFPRNLSHPSQKFPINRKSL